MVVSPSLVASEKHMYYCFNRYCYSKSTCEFQIKKVWKKSAINESNLSTACLDTTERSNRKGEQGDPFYMMLHFMYLQHNASEE